MKKQSIVLIAVMILAIISCNKEKATEDKLVPTLTILSPAADSMYMSDSVLISFTAADADLHSYEYEITNTADSSVIKSVDETHIPEDGLTTYTFSQKIKLPRPMHLKLEVTAADHSENETTKSVIFETKL